MSFGEILENHDVRFLKLHKNMVRIMPMIKLKKKHKIWYKVKNHGR